jgi:outer membrane receptor for ferric coprogen and ferric-rhodotorulic acid
MRVPGRNGNAVLAQFIALALAAAGSAAAQTSGAPPAKASELGKIQVEATEDDSANSYASQAVNIGGKTARDLRQVQQSVSIVTQERIQDQNLTDVTEALNQSTGVTLVATSSVYSAAYSRGFQINSVQSDSGSPSFFNGLGYFGLPDLAIYDRVEVLRGSDGLFSGAGEAGGTINLVRKRPQAQSQFLVEALAGRWDQYRVQLDATGSLGWDGRVRGRAVAAQEDRHYFYETAKLDKTVVYAIAEADLTDSTLVTLGGNYEQRDSIPNHNGLPRFANGASLDLSRDTCFCTGWSFWDTQTTEVFAKVEQKLGANWGVKLNVSQQKQQFDARYTHARGAVNPFTQNGAALRIIQSESSPRTRLGDISMNGKFDIAGHAQELLFGFNTQDVDSDGFDDSDQFWTVSSAYATNPLINVFTFDPGNFPDPGEPRFPATTYTRFGQKQSGVYASLRSSLTSRLHSVIGARYSDYEYKFSFTNTNITTGVPINSVSRGFETNNEFVPYGGLTFDVTDAISVYGSFSRIFQPQGNLVTRTGDALDPIEGNSYELGAKGAWLNNRVTASLAVYNIKRENAGVQLAGVTGTFGDLSCCYQSTAEIESKGADAEITGEILPGWQLFAGYTYNENQYKKGYAALDDTAFFPRTPKHLLKLWTMAQLPGTLSALSVGGGINGQSKTFLTGTAVNYGPNGAVLGNVPFQYTQGGYAVVSLRGELRFSEQWTAALNVTNLFDRTYYQTLGPSTNGNFYGEPRNYMLTLRGKF